ncbi:MAG: hypothetical protein LBK99_16450 [Opitutaceae bacterium]|jgi:hypothetical protein|nr:hypothetical protein [Opitutaceae bacterium]
MSTSSTATFAKRRITELSAKAEKIEFLRRDPATGRILANEEDDDSGVGGKVAIAAGATAAAAGGAAYARGRFAQASGVAPRSGSKFAPRTTMNTLKQGGQLLAEDAARLGKTGIDVAKQGLAKGRSLLRKAGGFRGITKTFVR